MYIPILRSIGTKLTNFENMQKHVATKSIMTLSNFEHDVLEKYIGYSSTLFSNFDSDVFLGRCWHNRLTIRVTSCGVKSILTK